ncbi:hypothetical protein RD110_04230 [Rhodoferax koreense]|uniref:DUF1840 domain-containing protein n=1 Tax=Rhodoferax koreensis TaxID=1842727 RepID=A0A1P8K383_9BURK|nr:DUF1840 domain-containing protein [Rhodoferax koreense]APW40459.1 hypothetical protein RD110_04230 [Rhodoferax koreense]
MLYKFKSKNAADVIMLEPNGRQVLQLIGKQTGPQGIIQPAEMTAAISALEAAIQQDEAAQRAAAAEAKAGQDGDEKPGEAISLRQRAAPFIDLLRRNARDGTEITWGA